MYVCNNWTQDEEEPPETSQVYNTIDLDQTILYKI